MLLESICVIHIGYAVFQQKVEAIEREQTVAHTLGWSIGKTICFVLTAVLVLRHIVITQQDFLLLQGYLPNVPFYGEAVLSFLTEPVVFGVFLTDCGIKSTDSWSYLVVVVLHVVAEYHNLGKIKKTPVFGIYEALFHTVGFRLYSFMIVFFLYFNKSQRQPINKKGNVRAIVVTILIATCHFCSNLESIVLVEIYR